MAKIDKKTGEKVYYSTNRQYETAPEYLGMFMSQIEKLGDSILSSGKGYSNPAIDMYIQMFIGLITDPEERERMRDYRKYLIESKLNEDFSAEDKNKSLFEINMDVLGEIMTNLDGSIGINVKQEIMRVAPEEDEKAMYEEYPDIDDHWACKVKT